MSPAGSISAPQPGRCVLVTGATGFIGSHLVRKLLAEGHAVTALTLQPERAAARLGPQVRCIAGAAALPPSEPIDVVVNLAGERILGPRWTAARKAALLHSRVDTTRDLVRWIAGADRKPALLLSASAIGYYGVQRQGDDSPLTEDSPGQPVFMSELCQWWEVEAATAAAHGVRVACMRFGVVLGREGALPMMLMPVHGREAAAPPHDHADPGHTDAAAAGRAGGPAARRAAGRARPAAARGVRLRVSDDGSGPAGSEMRMRRS